MIPSSNNRNNEGESPRAVSLLSVRESPSGKHKKLLLSDFAGEPHKGADGKPARPLYTVTQRLYREIGEPERGAILSPDALSAILCDDERFRATRQALRFLAYADNSEAGLVRKLRAKGYSREASAEAAREMVMQGFLREEDQLARRIAEEVNLRHTGPGKLIPKLLGKGFRKEEIEKTLARLREDGTVDLEAAKRALLQKELPRIERAYETEKERKDAARKLLFRYGWHTGSID